MALWTAARATVRALRSARAAVQVAEGNRRPTVRALPQMITRLSSATPASTGLVVRAERSRSWGRAVSAMFMGRRLELGTGLVQLGLHGPDRRLTEVGWPTIARDETRRRQ